MSTIGESDVVFMEIYPKVLLLELYSSPPVLSEWLSVWYISSECSW